jgi:hypothetical protein
MLLIVLAWLTSSWTGSRSQLVPVNYQNNLEMQHQFLALAEWQSDPELSKYGKQFHLTIAEVAAHGDTLAQAAAGVVALELSLSLGAPVAMR